MKINERLRLALYVLFFVSGFAGLIYESIWSHYLKLFLGHAAYAQTLVLVIFMGGMAVGAWFAASRSRELSDPLRIYAFVEVALGFAALGFDTVFRGAQNWVFDSAIPNMQSALLIDLLKWSLGAAIIFPQSMLLGATFPLMTTGFIRNNPEVSERGVACLYFTNSIGAAVGVLVSGFYLVALLGLPGTIAIAGSLNLALAAGVLLVARIYGARSESAELSPPVQVHPMQPESARRLPLMLTAAFLTGMASFLYEVAWLRMLSLVLGSATHAFELMLSAFISGLALGSYYIRGRISDRDPLRQLALIQIGMACAAFLSVPVYNASFDWMQFFMSGLRRSESGYLMFNAVSHAICLAVMLPITFFAGMTLPTITAILLREGNDERSVGRVYAANTVGSIVGVLFAIHLVMPYTGLRSVVIAGASIDLALGAWLLYHARHQYRHRLAVVVALTIGGFVAGWVGFDPAQMASGVFRAGVARNDGAVAMHEDGKTSTIDVVKLVKGGMSISTNGKVDAGVRAGNPLTSDDYTMQFTALLPMMAKPDATKAAVIGMGSGRTTHTLLANSRLTEVDTIEIEPAMVKGASYFKEFNWRVFDDPRSHIHMEDAKTYFARNGKKYDYIVAEPSNPWVSGVSSLFSTEFYRQIKRYLEPNGIFVQWFQLYEINSPLTATVLRAIDEQFEDYAIYFSNDVDCLILASPKGTLPSLSNWVFNENSPREILASIDAKVLADVEGRRIASKTTLERFFTAFPVPANSDYLPILDQYAVKQRFLSMSFRNLQEIRRSSIRLGDNTAPNQEFLTPVRYFQEGRYAQQARLIAAHYSDPTFYDKPEAQGLNKSTRRLLTVLATLQSPCSKESTQGIVVPALVKLVARFMPYLTANATSAISRKLRAGECFNSESSEVRDWIDLFEASGTRNWQVAQSIGEKIVARNRPKEITTAARELLLANLALGDTAAATRHLETLERQHKDLMTQSWTMQYLSAIVRNQLIGFYADKNASNK